MLKNSLKSLLVVGCWSAFGLQAASQPVARVSMTVGDAQRVSSSGQATPLFIGAQLSEQDRIITGKDAMVILIFSDQARVALRPESELLIRRYKVDPKGTETQLDLDLLRGTVRQISGHAAQKQPERYRLNTPIAAIGVRGTDFLARARDGITEAYVHEGAIVVAPLAGVGVLSEASSASLGAGYGVQYSRADRTKGLDRQAVSHEDVERLFGIRIASISKIDTKGGMHQAGRADGTVVASLPPARDRDAPGTPVTAASASLSGGMMQSVTMMIAPAMDSSLVASLPIVEPPVVVAPPVVEPPTTPPVVVVPPVVEPPITPPVVVVPPVTEPPTTPPTNGPVTAQLVWGRFSNPQTLPYTLPRSFAEVSEGRHSTVGELGQYALLREGVNGSLDKSLRGQAEFSLTAGEAFYQQGGKTVALSLADPRLQVNFDRLTFNTQLGLTGAGVPAQQLNVSGRMNDEGVFLGTASGQRVAGALSRNGAEAGYLFKIGSGSAGQYQGITLWNAK